MPPINAGNTSAGNGQEGLVRENRNGGNDENVSFPASHRRTRGGQFERRRLVFHVMLMVIVQRASEAKLREERSGQQDGRVRFEKGQGIK